MTKKKSPAQLTREIEASTGISLTPKARPWEVEVFYRGDWQRSAGYTSKGAAIAYAKQYFAESGRPTSVKSKVTGKVVWFSKSSGQAHSTRKRSHSTIGGEGPSTEKFKQAAKWIRSELNKRADGSHPSHLASKLLAEADEKFKLGSYGVEGWAKSSRLGYQYLNYGDPYDATIVVRSNPTRATVIVALGGWATYAGQG